TSDKLRRSPVGAARPSQAPGVIGPLHAPAAQLATVGREPFEPGLRLRRPGEVVLEGLGTERMAVPDLDPEPLQEGGVDRLAGAGGPRRGGVLRQLPGPGRVELLARPDLDLVEPAQAVLGPAGGAFHLGSAGGWGVGP